MSREIVVVLPSAQLGWDMVTRTRDTKNGKVQPTLGEAKVRYIEIDDMLSVLVATGMISKYDAENTKNILVKVSADVEIPEIFIDGYKAPLKKEEEEIYYEN